MNETFPLIYCNGDSYSNDNYHDSLKNNVHANVIGNYCKGFVVNKSMSGCCNRRIIRTTLHDLIEERKRNPTQKIIALIGLSFEMRSELWVENITNTVPEESNFRSHQFSGKMAWREDLLNDVSVSPIKNFSVDEKFF